MIGNQITPKVEWPAPANCEPKYTVELLQAGASSASRGFLAFQPQLSHGKHAIFHTGTELKPLARQERTKEQKSWLELAGA